MPYREAVKLGSFEPSPGCATPIFASGLPRGASPVTELGFQNVAYGGASAADFHRVPLPETDINFSMQTDIEPGKKNQALKKISPKSARSAPQSRTYGLRPQESLPRSKLRAAQIPARARQRGHVLKARACGGKQFRLRFEQEVPRTSPGPAQCTTHAGKAVNKKSRRAPKAPTHANGKSARLPRAAAWRHARRSFALRANFAQTQTAPRARAAMQTKPRLHCKRPSAHFPKRHASAQPSQQRLRQAAERSKGSARFYPPPARPKIRSHSARIPRATSNLPLPPGALRPKRTGYARRACACACACA